MKFLNKIGEYIMTHYWPLGLFLALRLMAITVNIIEFNKAGIAYHVGVAAVIIWLLTRVHRRLNP